MIETKQLGSRLPYRVYIDGEPVCEVRPILLKDGAHDWPATKARAEHIAHALRHYQQSQEGDRVP